MVPRLRETRSRGQRRPGITQPRHHSLADPCKVQSMKRNLAEQASVVICSQMFYKSRVKSYEI